MFCSFSDGVRVDAGVALFGYALERYHYTVDVLLAGYLTVGAWMGALYVLAFCHFARSKTFEFSAVLDVHC